MMDASRTTATRGQRGLRLDVALLTLRMSTRRTAPCLAPSAASIVGVA